MHWIHGHPDNERDGEFVRAFQPASLKLFNGMWDNKPFMDWLLAILPPDCIILVRDHPLSEQKEDMWADPVGTGTRHAREWAEKVRNGQCFVPIDRSFFLGINEPDATNGDRNAIDLYTEAFLNELTRNGLHGGAFNFSTGHPRTVDGTGATGADYSVFERSHRAIVAGNHLAVLHIYGTAAQPCVPGHYNRLWDCNWMDVTWVVGECGIDEHVVGGGEHNGYLISLVPTSEYPHWLERLILGCGDSRIHSWQPFTYDFHQPWWSFDLVQCRAAFAAWNWLGISAKPPIPPVGSGTVVFLPVVSGPTTGGGEMPDHFGRVMQFISRWEGGFVNDPRDRGGATNMGITQGTLTRWRQAHGQPAATVDDVKNLTREEANAIYYQDYWLPSGAGDAVDYPTALLLMDSAVLHGVGAPMKWKNDPAIGLDPWKIAAKRLSVYTADDDVRWNAFGRGWTNRVADLLKEVGANSG